MSGRISENPHLFGVFMPELEMATKMYNAALAMQHILNCRPDFDVPCEDYPAD
jgi:hypothetical protein